MLNIKLKSPVSTGILFGSLISTQNSQIADKDIGKNTKCLNVFIHLLGFGKDLSVLGRNDIIKYGNEMPKPRNKKMPIEKNIDDWVRAKPIAGAMKGVTQGVANSVTSTPTKKLLLALPE